MLLLGAMPPTEAPAFLGESWGFWLQFVILVITAILALFTIIRNELMARKRATIDLVLSENQDEKFRNIKEKYSLMRESGESFTALALPCISTDPDDIQAHADKKEIAIAILNQYEFIASAILEKSLDGKLYKRMKRGVVIRDWNALKPFVMELRRVEHRPRIFCETESLVTKWEKRS